MEKLIVVRHGETNYNVEGRYFIGKHHSIGDLVNHN